MTLSRDIDTLNHITNWTVDGRATKED